MSKQLDGAQPSAIFNAAALNAVSEVFAWSLFEQASFNVTAGAGTVAVETALTESGPFTQVQTFTDRLAITPTENVFRLRVTLGGPVTVIGQGYLRKQF
jgi:hypothetical protein